MKPITLLIHGCLRVKEDVTEKWLARILTWLCKALPILTAASVCHANGCDTWRYNGYINSVPGVWQSSVEAAIQNHIDTCNASPANKSACDGNFYCSLSGQNAGTSFCTFSRSSTQVSYYNYPYTNTLAYMTETVVTSGVTRVLEKFVSLEVDYPNSCGVYTSSSASSSAQCGNSCNSIDDPINPVNGNVISSARDLQSVTGGIPFERFYNSAGGGVTTLAPGWSHSFSSSIKPKFGGAVAKLYFSGPDNSSRYSSEAAACTDGFAEIKARNSTWAAVTANYTSGICWLIDAASGINVGTLPLFYSSPYSPPTGPPTVRGYDVTRDDGQVITFTVNGSVIGPPPGSGVTLQSLSGGFKLTDGNDNAEVYDSSGRLLSISSRSGIVRTLTYDGSWRLSTVTDNFGHILSLSYNAQGRLSSVTEHEP